MLYPNFKIDKPIRIIELFGGYGSQLLALKYLGVKVEQWKLCEWAVKSIQAYKDLHCGDDNKDYSKNLSIEEIKDYLFNKGISSNYNDPMTKEQVNRLNEKQVRTIYNNIQATHNLVNIQQVKGSDLCIKDTDRFTYLLTYSFPCQDLSLAGKGKGMSDTTTRSGLLWEVERILSELEEKPQVLLMENVPQVHGEGAKEDFNRWQLRLEELGYKNYWKDLIATDYGIPQTRNRTFMVSILGDYNYTFPKTEPLKLKLKDMLEDEVDEKYFLSDAMINYVSSRMPAGDNKITTGISVGNRDSLTKAATLCTTGGENNGVVVNMKVELCNNLIKEGKVKENDVIRHSYTTSRNEDWDKRSVEQNNLSPTLDTRCDCLGVCVDKHNMNSNLRIRKLTPRECFRLMGVKDEDFDKVAKNQSDSSLYHLAGDSIVVNVLMAIFKEMMN